MPIKCTTPISQIDEYMRQQFKRQEQALVNTFNYIGERCVNEARSYNGNAYQDQTGNLRSSVGYVVAVDGKIRSSSTFENVRNGEQGSRTGKEYATELVKQYPKGVVLIVVAGMNYAKYVEAKGYDVLTSAELLAEQLVPKLLNDLFK